jgi:hypothetical protein
MFHSRSQLSSRVPAQIKTENLGPARLTALAGFLWTVAAAPSEPSPTLKLLGNVILMVRTKKLRKTDIMTSQTSNARRFSPIFVATITPATVSTKTAQNGNKYAIMKGATIAQEGKEPKEMTVMAFGKSHEAVAKLLRKGRSVDLAVQYDGGTVKIVGLPRVDTAEAA